MAIMISKYVEKKRIGFASVVPIGNDYYTVALWSLADDKIVPETFQCTRKDIEVREKELVAELESLRAIKADMS